MENYISVNGVPLVSNTKLMNGLLRDDLGWDGMMVTDYAEIDQLADFHRVARTYDEATRISLTRASADMSMIATDDSFMNGTKARNNINFCCSGTERLLHIPTTEFLLH
ncbi:hypothetical protein PR003_g34936, partial [Phytophthora rubi]